MCPHNIVRKLHAKFGEAGALGCRDMMYRRKYREKNDGKKIYGEKNDRVKNDEEKNYGEKNNREKNDREKNYGEKNGREKNYGEKTDREKNGREIPILDPKIAIVKQSQKSNQIEFRHAVNGILFLVTCLFDWYYIQVV